MINDKCLVDNSGPNWGGVHDIYEVFIRKDQKKKQSISNRNCRTVLSENLLITNVQADQNY